MRTRKLLMSLSVVLCGVSLATCGGNNTKKPGLDAGNLSPDRPIAECNISLDCYEGDCINLKCVKCTTVSCGAGKVCSQVDLKCLDCGDGGCVGVPTDASVAGCTKREDCAAGLTCRAGKCQPADPTGKCLVNDECVAGQVCNFTNNTCIVGCFSNADCKGVFLDGGLTAPHCDTAVTNQCGPCVDSNDCALGERCTAGRCEKAPECVPPDRTPCGDRACMALDGGFTCAPCLKAEDCGAGYECVGGKCKEKATGCTDDNQCKTISPGHICDKGSGQCEWGCLVGTDGGSCTPNCCPTDETCNPATHKCSGSSTCTDCNPPCMGMNEVCDTSTCQCRNENDYDGGSGPAGECDSTKCTGCPAGQKCKCFGQFECNPLVGCGPLAAICTAN